MPRLTNSLARYRKHRASGHAVVTLGGADHYLGRHGTKASRTLYDRLVAQWLAAGRRMNAAETATLTVVELCSQSHQSAKGYYQEKRPLHGHRPWLKATINNLRE